jgi:hypothetical protein
MAIKVKTNLEILTEYRYFKERIFNPADFDDK